MFTELRVLFIVVRGWSLSRTTTDTSGRKYREFWLWPRRQHPARKYSVWGGVVGEQKVRTAESLWVSYSGVWRSSVGQNNNKEKGLENPRVFTDLFSLNDRGIRSSMSGFSCLRFRYDFRTRAYLMSTLTYVDLNGSFGTPVPGDLLCRVDEAQQYSLGFPTCI